MYSTIKEAINNFSDWQVCETVLWAKTSEKSYKLSNENLEEGYIPIGLYVVPIEHIHDGLHRFMSLKYMNYSTPSAGSTSAQGIYWGNYQNNIEGLKNYLDVLQYTNSSPLKTISLTAKDSNDNVLAKKLIINEQPVSVITAVSASCVSSDKFSGATDKLNNKFKFNESSQSCPCPYGTDDLLNPCFIDTTVNPKNALADFSGKQNTNLIVKYATSQSDWKTASSITNNNGAGYAPAACCCKRYDPDGFTKFQWYLPSLGELVYVCVKQAAINAKLALLNANYSSLVASSLASSDFWSSTSYSADRAYNVYFSVGNVDWDYRSSSGYVVSFLSA